MTVQTITLDGDTDWPGFRQAARRLLASGVLPEQVEWHTRDSAAQDLFASIDEPPSDSMAVQSREATSGAGNIVPAPLLAQVSMSAELQFSASDDPADEGNMSDIDASAALREASEVDEPTAVDTDHHHARSDRSSLPSAPATATVPAGFIELCKTVVLHQDPGRFGLLYRLLWRLTHEPSLRNDPIDADRTQARLMAQAVRRDLHKMKAFVRFRTIVQPEHSAPLHVAWFEPEHHIVEAAAPFFARRFTQMRWVILTPERSMEWVPPAEPPRDDAPLPEREAMPIPKGELRFGPGARKQDASPPDAGEALWLTYYSHIFNPARLKLAMMQKEMPRRYWRNLPEAELISPLVASAMARSGQMIEAPATQPARRIAAVKRIAFEASLEEPAMNEDIAANADPAVRLATLKKATDRCRECPIGEFATQSVFGEGPAGASVMVVGEQPGDQEDLRGRPFVGPAGRLFDRAIAQLGWPRERLYVTNAVKHFKFELKGTRRIHKTPSQQEAAACLHWLESELAQVRPQAVIALGATAARSLLGRPVAVMKERGQWHTGARGERVLVTLHPSALLRGDPAQHEQAYAAWLEDLALATETVTTVRDRSDQNA